MKKVEIIFVKSLFRGIDHTWVIIPEFDKTPLLEGDNFKQFPHFDFLAEAQEYCEKNNLEVKFTTPITYKLDNNKMQVYFGDSADVSYSDVKNKKQALSLLEEDFGV